MEVEARGLVAACGLEKPGGPLSEGVSAVARGLPGALCFSGRSGGAELIVVSPGQDPRYRVDRIGTEAAALLAHLAIESFHPDLVISAGTAGGFRAKGAAVGDVFLSAEPVVFHDRRIALPGFREMGIGSYPCIDTASVAEALGLKRGVVTSGSSLDHPETDLAVMRETGGSVKEMEAAAIAWVCMLRGVPFLAVKSITDLMDGGEPTQDEFMANLERASARLTEELLRVIAWVGERGLSSS